MIEHSFVFLERFSEQREQKLWQEGIRTWNDFLARERIQGIGLQKKQYYDVCVRQARQHLNNKDLQALMALFPKRYHWRLYNLFKDQALALDIETTGYYGDITVIGLHDSLEQHFLVKNKNLSHEPLQQLLKEPSLLLTFNGLSFDVPVIKRRFPQLEESFARQAHIDLRFVAASLGLTGGLKVIEERLGLSRGEELQGVCGADAVWLWNNYCMCGEEEYLERLLDYNEADCKNLFYLAEKLIPQLWAETFTTVHSQKQ